MRLPPPPPAGEHGPRRPRAAAYLPALDLIDTGCGIDDHTALNMFDAFYSTKDGGSRSRVMSTMAADMPTVPLLSSKPPAAAGTYVKGFVPAGNLTELFNTVWLDK